MGVHKDDCPVIARVPVTHDGRVAWVVTEDRQAGYNLAGNHVGAFGPDNSRLEDRMRALSRGTFWRMVNGLGDVAAVGRIWTEYPLSPVQLARLYDFGYDQWAISRIEIYDFAQSAWVGQS